MEVNTGTDRILGNTTSLEDLYRSSGGSSSTGDPADGTAMDNDAVNGIITDGENEESGELPSWLESQLDATNSSYVENLTEEERAEKQKKNLLITLIISFVCCAYLTIVFGVVLYKSAKKRQERRVHY